MPLSLWEVFLSLFRRGEETDVGEENDERFVPSPLDISVRVAHGGHDDERARELEKIHDQARDIEDPHRNS